MFFVKLQQAQGKHLPHARLSLLLDGFFENLFCLFVIRRNDHKDIIALFFDHCAVELGHLFRLVAVSYTHLPGDFLGKRQHGLPQLKIADLGSSMEMMEQVQQAAELLLEPNRCRCV